MISIHDFVNEVNNDLKCCLTSNFSSRIAQCRDTVLKIDENLHADKDGISKLKSATKDVFKSAHSHVNSELELSRILNRVGETSIVRGDESDEIGVAFQKFALINQDLANLLRNSIDSLDTLVLTHVDRLLKRDLRSNSGGIVDVKKSVDKSFKEYGEKVSDIEKTRKKMLAKGENGLNTPKLCHSHIDYPGMTPVGIRSPPGSESTNMTSSSSYIIHPDQLTRERKGVQLSTAEFMMKANDVQVQKSVILLQKLIEYYKTQYRYFQGGMKLIDSYGPYLEDLTDALTQIQTDHESERRSLVQVCDRLQGRSVGVGVGNDVTGRHLLTKSVSQSPTTSSNSSSSAASSASSSSTSSINSCATASAKKAANGQIANLKTTKSCASIKDGGNGYPGNGSCTSNTLSTMSNSTYTLHQAKGNAEAGTFKVGYLSKRSEGRLRNVWLKRKCRVGAKLSSSLSNTDSALMASTGGVIAQGGGDGFLEIFHADESKQPTLVNLLTCQIRSNISNNSSSSNNVNTLSSKTLSSNFNTPIITSHAAANTLTPAPIPLVAHTPGGQGYPYNGGLLLSSSIATEDNTSAASVCCFDVISFNRHYHFQAESESSKDEWVSVLLNCKDAALNHAFFNDSTTGVDEKDSPNSGGNRSRESGRHGLRELQKLIVTHIKTQLSGNGKCCDCDSNNDANWISTNYGIIVCIECSGIHREMGVHISKIQSLTLDRIGTSHLLLARYMSNSGFNKVYEAKLKDSNDFSDIGGLEKLNPNSSMDERRTFIKAKYIERRFVRKLCTTRTQLLSDLESAIDTHNVYDVLQAYGEMQILPNSQCVDDVNDPSEQVHMGCSLPSSEYEETPLHHAISHETGRSLHIIDFLIQNATGPSSSILNAMTTDGNTPLHYAAVQNQSEAMRLLLRSGADITILNKNGKTALSLAQDRNHRLCVELLEHASQQKKSMFENVNIEWNLLIDGEETTKGGKKMERENAEQNTVRSEQHDLTGVAYSDDELLDCYDDGTIGRQPSSGDDGTLGRTKHEWRSNGYGTTRSTSDLLFSSDGCSNGDKGAGGGNYLHTDDCDAGVFSDYETNSSPRQNQHQQTPCGIQPHSTTTRGLHNSTSGTARNSRALSTSRILSSPTSQQKHENTFPEKITNSVTKSASRMLFMKKSQKNLIPAVVIHQTSSDFVTPTKPKSMFPLASQMIGSLKKSTTTSTVQNSQNNNLNNKRQLLGQQHCEAVVPNATTTYNTLPSLRFSATRGGAQPPPIKNSVENTHFENTFNMFENNGVNIHQHLVHVSPFDNLVERSHQQLNRDKRNSRLFQNHNLTANRTRVHHHDVSHHRNKYNTRIYSDVNNNNNNNNRHHRDYFSCGEEEEEQDMNKGELGMLVNTSNRDVLNYDSDWTASVTRSVTGQCPKSSDMALMDATPSKFYASNSSVSQNGVPGRNEIVEYNDNGEEDHERLGRRRRKQRMSEISDSVESSKHSKNNELLMLRTPPSSKHLESRTSCDLLESSSRNNAGIGRNFADKLNLKMDQHVAARRIRLYSGGQDCSGGSSDTSPPLKTLSSSSNSSSNEEHEEEENHSEIVRNHHFNTNTSAPSSALVLPNPKKQRTDYPTGTAPYPEMTRTTMKTAAKEQKICRALYDCIADNDDELTFKEGDLIYIQNEDTQDENWMEGSLLSNPEDLYKLRSGTGGLLFPISFVSRLSEKDSMSYLTSSASMFSQNQHEVTKNNESSIVASRVSCC